MDAGALFDKMLIDLQDDGVVEGDLRQERTLVLAGVTFGVLRSDGMAFRLGHDRLDARGALSLPGARRVDVGTPNTASVSSVGQPPNETDPAGWVAVPLTECQEWERFATQALAYARRG